MEKYIPDAYQESVFKVNYDLLYSNGVKCLLFDLDNTLVPSNVKSPTNEIKELIKNLSEKFEIVIFSNGLKKRVSTFAEELNVEYVYGARKPFSKSFCDIIKKHKKGENEVAIIGDQLLTDIRGGNQVGIVTVLVNPVSSSDQFLTKFNRLREKSLIKKLRKFNLFRGNFYDEKM